MRVKLNFYEKFPEKNEKNNYLMRVIKNKIINEI